MLARDSLYNKVCLDYPPSECSHKYFGWPCYVMYYRSNFRPYFYNEDEAKRRISCGPYFQIPNYLFSHKNVHNSIEICSHGSIWHIISFASGNGLASTRRHALYEPIVTQIPWHIYELILIRSNYFVKVWALIFLLENYGFLKTHYREAEWAPVVSNHWHINCIFRSLLNVDNNKALHCPIKGGGGGGGILKNSHQWCHDGRRLLTK